MIRKLGDDPEDYVVRAKALATGTTHRSISAEIKLEPGTYEVIPKILARRDPTEAPLGVIVSNAAERNPSKLRQLGFNHDVAQAKAVTSDELQERDIINEYLSNGFICDVCTQVFDETRPMVHCLVCVDYFLCPKCHETGGTSLNHETSHQMRGMQLLESQKVFLNQSTLPEHVGRVLHGDPELVKQTLSPNHLAPPVDEDKLRVERDGLSDRSGALTDDQSSSGGDNEGPAQQGGQAHQNEAEPIMPLDSEQPPVEGCPPPQHVSPEEQEQYSRMAEEQMNPVEHHEHDMMEGPPREQHENPWNAVCVIGLRVYSKQVGMEISLVHK